MTQLVKQLASLGIYDRSIVRTNMDELLA
jgi:hypothetical protein